MGYHSCIFRRDAAWVGIDERCWMEIISTQHQAVVLRLETHLFVHFKSCGSTTYVHFPQYLLTQEHHSPIHQLLTAESNSSSRARGHVGSWVKFHPASLSEGSLCDFLWINRFHVLYKNLYISIKYQFYTIELSIELIGNSIPHFTGHVIIYSC